MATEDGRMDGFRTEEFSREGKTIVVPFSLWEQTGDKVLSKDERVHPPAGWQWEDEWTIDTNRAVDEQGHLHGLTAQMDRFLFRFRVLCQSNVDELVSDGETIPSESTTTLVSSSSSSDGFVVVVVV